MTDSLPYSQMSRRSTKVVTKPNKDIKDEERKWVGYVRVSTEKQHNTGVSLDAQQKMIEEFAKSKGFDLKEIITEQVSGSVNCAERKGFGRIIKMMDEKTINGVIVHKLDRISRNISDQSSMIDKYFRELGNKLMIIEMSRLDLSNPNDRMLINMMGALSQYEREIIISRTVTALNYMKQTGLKTGGYVPYGKTVEDAKAPKKKLVENKDETELWDEMRALKEHKGLSYGAICEILTQKGILNRKGICKWSPSQVLRIMYPDKCPRKVYKRKPKNDD